MFRCELCSSVVPAKIPATLLVLETRSVTYPERRAANPHEKGVDRCTTCKESKMRHKHLDHDFRSPSDDPGGAGVEAVRTVRVCPACAG